MTEISPASIVIPTLNEEHYLPVLLESLANIDAPMDIIVVDGNSTDRTVRIAENFISRFRTPSTLRVLHAPERGGARQRNVGASSAVHPILIFMDADTVIPSPLHYAQMVSSFKEAGYVVAAPRLVALEREWRARLLYWMFYMFQRIFFVFGKPYFGGGCLLTKKEVFEKIGGFDEALPLGEDIDYSERAASEGPSGFLPVHIYTSARRFIKYGYWRYTKEYIRVFSIIVMKGRLALASKHIPADTFYPFGEHSGR